MTLAAEELCVTHGAVSRQVKALETALGVALTEGPRNGLRLTPAGRELAAQLTPAFDALEAALPPSPAATEVLNLACVGTLASKWLIPRLPGFVAQRPGASVRIIDHNGPTAEANCALQLGHHVPPDAWEVTSFLTRHHAPVIVRDRASEILTAPRLISQTYPDEWTHWASATQTDLPPATRVIEFARYLQAMDGAKAGLGATIGSWFAVKAEVEAGVLVAPLGFVRAITPCVFVRARPSSDPLTEHFRAWLLEEGARSPPPPDVRTPD